MGVSTDAILFYGIDYGEDGLDISELKKLHGVEEDDDYLDFDDLYVDKCGLVRPEFISYGSPEAKEYFTKRLTLLTSGCGVDTHCSNDYPIYFAYVRESRYRCYRGSSVEIPNGLTANPEWDQKLKDYCDMMKLEYREPKWLLVSYWG